jgi:hypothetical protein
MMKEWGIPFRPSPACASREKSTVVILATEDPYLIHSPLKGSAATENIPETWH